METLDFLRGVPAHLVLRPPHTSHRSQGEDVVGFSVMKPALRKRKGEALAEKLISKKGTRLTLDDYGACVKQPVEEAFSRARNLASWDKIGVVPFTRRVYWELKAEEEEAAALANQAEAPTWNKGAAQFPSHSGGGGGGGGGGDDDEGAAPVGDGTDRSQHSRLASADLWNLGKGKRDTRACGDVGGQRHGERKRDGACSSQVSPRSFRHLYSLLAVCKGCLSRGGWGWG